MNRIITFLLVGTLVVLSACGTKKHMLGVEITEKKKTSELFESVEKQGEKEVSFFYSKIACKYKSTEQNLSFKTSVKINSDSLINVMMTFAKIPVMIANVTKDSVKIINKRDKCFFYTDIDYLSNLLSMNLTLRDAEDIFIGRPIAFEEEKKYHQLYDSSFYVLSTHKEKDFSDVHAKDVMIKYYLSPDSLKLQKTYISSPKDSTELTIHMNKTMKINGMDFPYLVQIEGFGKKGPLSVELKYQKTSIDEPKTIYFNIPENYNECE